MKVEEVPQDGRFMENTCVRDIYYAQDADGKFTPVASIGWQAKNDALSMVWDDITEKAETVRREVLAGQKSPLAYHLETHVFTIPMIAAYTGIPRRIVKRHLKPEAFAKLNEETFEKYAYALDMSVEELKKI